MGEARLECETFITLQKRRFRVNRQRSIHIGGQKMYPKANVLRSLINRPKHMSSLWLVVLLLCWAHTSFGQTAILVDDDGIQCPNSVRSIQEAVAGASAGSTILVCSGIYQGTVNIIGHDKDRLKIVAADLWPAAGWNHDCECRLRQYRR